MLVVRTMVFEVCSYRRWLLTDVSVSSVIMALALDLHGPRGKDSSSTSPSPTTHTSSARHRGIHPRIFYPRPSRTDSLPSKSASAIRSGPQRALTCPASATPDKESLIP